ncbi:MAG TPA: flagellar basal body rod protein FlgB [Terriglobales bacterium]|nr:flagellar basal body rod protein FlgB [Terriglobales bacterium]
MRSMIDTPEIRSLSRFLDLDVFRQGVITSNLANIDTPGYRARDINFRQELDRAAWNQFQSASADTVMSVNGMQSGLQSDGDDAAFTPLARRVSGLVERPDGNNVSLERETLLLAETQLRFNVGIQLLRAEFRMLSTAIHEGSTS